MESKVVDSSTQPKVVDKEPKGPKRTPNLKDRESHLHCTGYCWILEILYCNPKGRRALLRIPSSEGRSVCLCWAKSKPKGPKKDLKDLPHLEPEGPVFSMVSDVTILNMFVQMRRS